jgi:putative serine/threonine protein kinase
MAVQNLDKLTEEPYASIICYPKVQKIELKKRLTWLRKLGITALEFSGQKQLLNTCVLGKGCVGIVVIAWRKGRRVALKIRRVDADRENMIREAELLTKANRQRVGPKLIDVCNDFLVMRLVRGDLLPQWSERRVSKTQARRVSREILEQCWRLDVAGLDHGELSHAPKHIIIDARMNPIIVDFETASENRRSSNVTSMCQFLFMSKTMVRIARKIGVADKEAIIAALRGYKKEMNRENFDRVLESCGL